MKIVKAFAVAGLAAGASLALGAPAMAAAKPAPAKATLKAAHAKVKAGQKIAFSGAFTGEKKGVKYVALLLEKGKDGKFHTIPVKGKKGKLQPLEVVLNKSGKYTFTVTAAKKAGKETFEVDVLGITAKKPVKRTNTISNAVTVTVTVAKGHGH
jgi:hypothetical protein